MSARTHVNITNRVQCSLVLCSGLWWPVNLWCSPSPSPSPWAPPGPGGRRTWRAYSWSGTAPLASNAGRHRVRLGLRMRNSISEDRVWSFKIQRWFIVIFTRITAAVAGNDILEPRLLQQRNIKYWQFNYWNKIWNNSCNLNRILGLK